MKKWITPWLRLWRPFLGVCCVEAVSENDSQPKMWPKQSNLWLELLNKKLLARSRCKGLRRVHRFYFNMWKSSPLITVACCLKEHISALRGYSQKHFSDWGQKDSVRHPFTAAPTDRSSALNGPILWDAFWLHPEAKVHTSQSHSVLVRWGVRVSNHWPEGHDYSFLLLCQYVLSFLKNRYGENKPLVWIATKYPWLC